MDLRREDFGETPGEDILANLLSRAWSSRETSTDQRSCHEFSSNARLFKELVLIFGSNFVKSEEHVSVSDCFYWFRDFMELLQGAAHRD